MVNSHINKDLKNCTGSGISHTTQYLLRIWDENWEIRDRFK